MNIEWPDLYVAADRLSGEGQSRQKRWFGGAISLNILGALLAGFAEKHEVAATLMFASLSLALGLSLSLLAIRPQSDWFNGRALAESVKTLAWRFVTCTVPYGQELPDQQAENAFLSSIGLALAEAISIGSGLSPASGQSLQITASMWEARKLDLCGRRDLYVDQRLQNQQQWYARSAKRNRQAETLWALAFVICQCGAVAVAAFALRSSSFALGIVGVVTTAGSGIAAWQQQCQFGALASAYGMTAQELSTIQSHLLRCSTEEELSDFILSAERAISREHTYWLARRRNA